MKHSSIQAAVLCLFALVLLGALLTVAVALHPPTTSAATLQPAVSVTQNATETQSAPSPTSSGSDFQITYNSDGSFEGHGPNLSISKDTNGCYEYHSDSVSISKDASGSFTYQTPSESFSKAASGAFTYHTPTLSLSVDASGAYTYQDESFSLTKSADGSVTYNGLDERRETNIAQVERLIETKSNIQVPDEPLVPTQNGSINGKE